jgi:hypothetical protein
MVQVAKVGPVSGEILILELGLLSPSILYRLPGVGGFL